MHAFHRGVLLLSALAAMVFSVSANAQTSTGAATTAGAGSSPGGGVPVVLPKAYESMISSMGSLVTSGTAALKTNRSDARSLAFRIALSKKLLAAVGTPITSISLDKDDTDASLGEIAILCAPRQNYISNVVALNYLNTLVQDLNTVSTPSPVPTDIAGALKLLLTTSGYSISDNVKTDAVDVSALAKTTLSTCTADLRAYDKVYYGAQIGSFPPAPAAAPAATGGAPISFAFLGPIGSLIDTFISILQPVLIDASTFTDQLRRQEAIMAALNDPTINAKIDATGQQLATAVDTYAAASRYNTAGSFVELLVSIREMSIDLSSEQDCKNLAATRLPSGAPNATFIGCWHAAWAKLQPQVASLVATGDNYDALADAGNVSAQKLFGTILADYNLINKGEADNSAIFWNDVTEFITFANAITNAASASNIAALKKSIAAVNK